MSDEKILKQQAFLFKVQHFLPCLITGLYFLIVFSACNSDFQQTPSVTSNPITGSKSETEPLSDHIFIYHPDGIQKITLADNSFQNLLTIDADWPDWKASFAQNRKYLAYTIRKGNGVELWFTSLKDWQPKRLMTVNNVDFDFATPLWIVNDRYLLLDLSILEKGEVIEVVKNIRTYIFDIETMELVHQPYWIGDCFTLAPSPKTEQLAIWCNTNTEIENPEYLVLEVNETPWLTQESPEVISNDCSPRTCSWSADGKFVAYIEEDFPGLLYSASVHTSEVNQLDDKQTDSIYQFPRWSPDGQFIYYTGDCTSNFQLPTVMSVADQEIIWCIPNVSNHGKYGTVSVVPVTWSPNSRHLAIPISPNLNEEILIIDMETQQEYLRISNSDIFIMDMVWIND